MYCNIRFWLYGLMTWWWPESAFLMPAKRLLLRLCGVRVGRGVQISSGVKFLGSGRIEIGEGAVLHSGVQIGGRGHVEIGRGVKVWNNCIVRCNGRISIGESTEVFQNSVLMANGNSCLKIGANCQIAHMVSLKTSHHFIDPTGSCIAGKERFDDIAIGDGCWICAGAIVIPGVRIGRKNVIAAGAVVINDTADFSLMAGVPAVCRKNYKSL